MKKKFFLVFLLERPILLSLLFFAIIPKASAQIGEFRNGLSLGGNAGATFSSVSFDPTIKQGSLIGKTVGVTFCYTSEKYFKTICALQVELNYAELGWKEEIMNSSQESISDTYQKTLRYIQLPLLTKLGWGKEDNGLMFFFIAGPQISYCFGESVKQSEFTLNDTGYPDRPNGVFQQYDQEVKNKIDYGIIAGFGLELSTKVGSFDIEGLYYYGLGDIYGNSKKDSFSRSANSSIILKCAYLIAL